MKGWLVCLLLLLNFSAAQLPLKSVTDQTPTTTPSPSASTPTDKSTSTTSTTPTSTPPSTPTSVTNTQSASSSSTTTATTATSQPPASSPTNAPTAPTSASTASTSGGALTTTITSAGPSSPPPSVTPTSSSSDSSSGLGTGPIIGMSVAGGIALIAVIAFIIWKLTRKRFSEFDDNEAIKWPELNSHGKPDPHAMPANTTGRAGFETGSEASLSRVNTDNYSTPDFINGSGPDPYAVPPLPHLNPNQPYHDEPSGYYDPYSGPVPGTIEHEGVDWSGEAIPMTQMGARTMSPAPSAAFTLDTGRQSPGPRRASPGPQAAYGGGGGARYDPYGGR